jgi:hypothetical protein
LAATVAAARELDALAAGVLPLEVSEHLATVEEQVDAGLVVGAQKPVLRFAIRLRYQIL